MNVLIVEDSASARKLLRITFEHYGCMPFEAQDGQEGLELARLHRPDLIVSDALMPRMDGFQLLRAVKAEPGLASIPFIFYSATYTGDKERELALSLGADAFVAKPVEPEKLWDIASRIMRERESRQDSSGNLPIDEKNEQYLREYSRIVAAKLEEKVHELEEALARRTEAENALSEQEHELATIFENTPFVLLLLDGDRRIRRVNGLACRFTGLTINEILGRRTGEALRCIHALDAGEGCGFGPHCQGCVIRIAVVDTFENGRSYHHVETKMPVSVDGKEQIITFLFSASRVTVAHQSMVLLSLQDISEYKKLESQLHHAQKMESIGTLAGGIAHDFNNILTVIFGYGDITLMNMTEDDPNRQNVENMLDAAHRAASLAQDLLLFSRKEISDKRNVDLNTIVRSVDKFLRRVIGEDVVCTIGLADGTMPVYADAHQIEQVLMNLAANARDALPDGGTLSISTERIQLDDGFETSQGCVRSGPHAVLTVTDSGSGMDEETCQRIFDPFFTTKEAGKGTGLGLAVVYGIVQQHDGHIAVSSEPGHGTTFRIYLPLHAAAADDITVGALNGQPAGGTETILLAEDDESIRNMTVSLLRKFGYDLIVAVDGEDAVQKFRESRGRIQLLLFDVVMPRKSGIDAYDEIRRLEPDSRVLFASGYAADAVRHEVPSGANVTWITKPYLPSNLLATVRNALDGNSLS